MREEKGKEWREKVFEKDNWLNLPPSPLPHPPPPSSPPPLSGGMDANSQTTSQELLIPNDVSTPSLKPRPQALIGQLSGSDVWLLIYVHTSVIVDTIIYCLL